MNGLTIATFFAKMTPLHWLSMVVLVIGLIVYTGMTYFQVGDNTEDISANREMIQKIHETQIILVEGFENLGEGQTENTALLRAWMEKLYDQAVSEETTR